MILYCIALAAFIVGSLAVPTPSNNDLTGRIIGGINVTKEDDHPYIISLKYQGGHRCGGIIISEKHVITAAHCVYGEENNPDKFGVRAGTIKRTEGAMTDSDVTKITVHKTYYPAIVRDDIAVLEVNLPAFTTKINKIAVEEAVVPDNVPVILVGWGSTRANGGFSENLKEIELKMISNQDCKKEYDEYRITDSNICTSTAANTKGFCNGDSGGSLVKKVEEKKSLVGIASWGTPCARGKPDVFVRISSQFKWINDNCGNCLKPKTPPPSL